MSMIRAAVIGIGNMGTAHANTLYQGKVNGMQLAAVCDSNAKRLGECETLFPGVARFASAEELASSGVADAVIVAVPHPMHAKIGMLCLQHGLHTLVEKPIDVSLSQAQKLCETAKASGKIFALMLNQRTNPLFRKAREIVHGGELGELKRSVWIITNWYRTQHYYDSGDWRATWAGEGGGVLLNQAPHNLDLWQWICGMPVSVTAFCDIAKYHHIEVEDDATILTRYANGATGCFITTTGEFPGTNRLEISGTKGKLVLEDGKIKWWKLKIPEDVVRFESDVNFAKIDMDYEELVPEGIETAHLGVLQNYADAINTGAELLSPGYDGVYELTISNAAYLSSWQGNIPVALPLDTALFDRLLKEHADASAYVPGELSHKAADGKYSERWQVRW